MINFLIHTAHAAVQLPDLTTTDNLGVFFQNIYSFSITIVGILIFVRFLWGGFLYLTAAASPGNVKKAQDMMTNAIIGAILLFSAYLILYVINPDLVSNSFNFGGIVNNQSPGTPSTDYSGLTKMISFDVTPKSVSVKANPTMSFTFQLSGVTATINSYCAVTSGDAQLKYSAGVSLNGDGHIIYTTYGTAADFASGQVSKNFSQPFMLCLSCASDVKPFNPSANDQLFYYAQVFCTSGNNSSCPYCQLVNAIPKNIQIQIVP